MKNLKNQAFTLVELMIVVMIIGVLAAIAIPAYHTARQSSQENACISNLRVLNDAKQQHALQEGKKTGDNVAMTDLVTQVATTPLYLDSEPICPIEQDNPPDNYTSDLGLIGAVPVCKDFDEDTHNAFLKKNTVPDGPLP